MEFLKWQVGLSVVNRLDTSKDQLNLNDWFLYLFVGNIILLEAN